MYLLNKLSTKCISMIGYKKCINLLFRIYWIQIGTEELLSNFNTNYEDGRRVLEAIQGYVQAIQYA